jgi:hypothetical protein
MRDDADASEALLHDREGINRRAHLVKVIYWTDGELMPIDVFSYIREASTAFEVGCFLGAIALASCAVEIIINHDSRSSRSGGKDWMNLNRRTLQAAQGAGFPVQELLSPDERIDDEDSPVFVRRRNKTAHGDVSALIRTLSDYDPGAEAAAFDQLQKASRFVCEWFNSSPDVQQKRIMNHRWPSPGMSTGS